MMVHLYALADHPVRLPEATGIDAAPLESLRVDGIDAVLSSMAVEPMRATEEGILAHADVVERVTALNDAVLPARFAAAYEDNAALVEAVRRRAAQLSGALDRVRGCTEMGLQVMRPHTHDQATAASGGEYMRRRLSDIREGERVASEIEAALARIARATKRQVLASPQVLLTSAYLLPRDAVDAFRDAVTSIESRHAEFVFICTGPWPPYSFALVDDGPAE